MVYLSLALINLLALKQAVILSGRFSGSDNGTVWDLITLFELSHVVWGGVVSAVCTRISLCQQDCRIGPYDTSIF